MELLNFEAQQETLVPNFSEFENIYLKKKSRQPKTFIISNFLNYFYGL